MPRPSGVVPHGRGVLEQTDDPALAVDEDDAAGVGCVRNGERANAIGADTIFSIAAKRDTH